MLQIHLRGFLVGALLLCLSLLCSTWAVAQANGVARKIVVFQAGMDEMAQDAILQHAGALKMKGLPLVHGAAVQAGPAALRALARQTGVLRIDDDAEVFATGKPPKPPAPSPAEALPWGIGRIQATLIWDTDNNLVVDDGAIAGAGVKVAVVDTGIDLTHPDLAANIKGGINTINPAASYTDDNGHGTHVAGTIAGIDNTIGVVGVAPQASLYAVKVLNKRGSGYLSDIIEGLQWCIDNGMQVINMSLGTPSNVLSFHQAVQAAFNSGIVVVASAGNSGPGSNTVEYPGKYAEAIAVAATDSANSVASWSSRGPEVELAAPGVSIYSTYKGGGYATMSGTSMASPHVAGAAALLISSGIVVDLDGDGLINGEVRAKLGSTVTDLGAAGRDTLYGLGLINVFQAITAP